MTNIFSTLYWSMVQSQNASISISYGSISVFCSEASLKRRFFQYIKACFVEYAQLSEQKCLDHISQRVVYLLCFFHHFYFGFVMKHKYKSKWAKQVGWVGQLTRLTAYWDVREKFPKQILPAKNMLREQKFRHHVIWTFSQTHLAAPEHVESNSFS